MLFSASGLELVDRILAANLYWKSIFVSHFVKHRTLVLQLMQGYSAVAFCKWLIEKLWARSTPSFTIDEIHHETKDGQEGERRSNANASFRSAGKTIW